MRAMVSRRTEDSSTPYRAALLDGFVGYRLPGQSRPARARRSPAAGTSHAIAIS